MRPDSRSALVHYMRSLAMPEAVCGNTAASTITLDAAQVTCHTCAKKLPRHTQPEKWLLHQVRAFAQQAGYLTYHTWRSTKSEPGFFDLVLAKAGRPLILSELKSATGALTIEQKAWQSVVPHITGVEGYVWRPQDLEIIVEILLRK